MKELGWLREEPKSPAFYFYFFIFFIMRSLFLGTRSFVQR